MKKVDDREKKRKKKEKKGKKRKKIMTFIVATNVIADRLERQSLVPINKRLLMKYRILSLVI